MKTWFWIAVFDNHPNFFLGRHTFFFLFTLWNPAFSQVATLKKCRLNSILIFFRVAKESIFWKIDWVQIKGAVVSIWTLMTIKIFQFWSMLQKNLIYIHCLNEVLLRYLYNPKFTNSFFFHDIKDLKLVINMLLIRCFAYFSRLNYEFIKNLAPLHCAIEMFEIPLSFKCIHKCLNLNNLKKIHGITIKRRLMWYFEVRIPILT